MNLIMVWAFSCFCLSFPLHVVSMFISLVGIQLQLECLAKCNFCIRLKAALLVQHNMEGREGLYCNMFICAVVGFDWSSCFGLLPKKLIEELQILIFVVNFFFLISSVAVSCMLFCYPVPTVVRNCLLFPQCYQEMRTAINCHCSD